MAVKFANAKALRYLNWDLAAFKCIISKAVRIKVWLQFWNQDDGDLSYDRIVQKMAFIQEAYTHERADRENLFNNVDWGCNFSRTQNLPTFIKHNYSRCITLQQTADAVWVRRVNAHTNSNIPWNDLGIHKPDTVDRTWTEIAAEEYEAQISMRKVA